MDLWTKIGPKNNDQIVFNLGSATKKIYKRNTRVQEVVHRTLEKAKNLNHIPKYIFMCLSSHKNGGRMEERAF